MFVLLGVILKYPDCSPELVTWSLLVLLVCLLFFCDRARGKTIFSDIFAVYFIKAVGTWISYNLRLTIVKVNSASQEQNPRTSWLQVERSNSSGKDNTCNPLTSWSCTKPMHSSSLSCDKYVVLHSQIHQIRSFNKGVYLPKNKGNENYYFVSLIITIHSHSAATIVMPPFGK